MSDIVITMTTDDDGPLFHLRGVTLRPGESVTLATGQVVTLNSVVQADGSVIITPTVAMRTDGPDPDGVLARVR